MIDIETQQARMAQVMKFFKENPNTWTKGADARRRSRHAISPTSPAAVKWSVEGKWQNLGFSPSDLAEFEIVTRNGGDAYICEINDGAKSVWDLEATLRQKGYLPYHSTTQD